MAPADPSPNAVCESNSDELYEYTPKRGVTFTLTAKDLVSRLVALAPPAKSHLTSFHGAYAPHAKLRGLVKAAPGPVEASKPVAQHRPAKTTKPRRPRLDWATLHQHTFGNDVLRCPCGGRRTIKALFSTHKAAEERLVELGQPNPQPAFARRDLPAADELRRVSANLGRQWLRLPGPLCVSNPSNRDPALVSPHPPAPKELTRDSPCSGLHLSFPL